MCRIIDIDDIEYSSTSLSLARAIRLYKYHGWGQQIYWIGHECFLNKMLRLRFKLATQARDQRSWPHDGSVPCACLCCACGQRCM